MNIVSKFNAEDRKLLIKEIKRIQIIELSPISSFRKLFRSNKGLMYLINGGTGLWHGINKGIVQYLKEEELSNKEGVFIVAKKYHTQIDVYVGSLSIFIKNIDKLLPTKDGGLQFHCILTEDGLFIEEIPQLVCNKVHSIYFPNHKRNIELYRQNASLLNIEVPVEQELTHADVEAKLLLIGSYLNYRTYTPDVSKSSTIFNRKLGDIASEQKLPEETIPTKIIDTIKMIDVIWFDQDGYPTHAFEVEHTTDITKGLLRLYQTTKLKIKMYIISNQEKKFETEVSKSPFAKIKNDFILKNYDELEEFFESVKHFKQMKDFFNI